MLCPLRLERGRVVRWRIAVAPQDVNRDFDGASSASVAGIKGSLCLVESVVPLEDGANAHSPRANQLHRKRKVLVSAREDTANLYV